MQLFQQFIQTGGRQTPVDDKPHSPAINRMGAQINNRAGKWGVTQGWRRDQKLASERRNLIRHTGG
ncbi:hypothetical protein AA0482_1197 [Acetobacter cibinongensis NRIC 0482]|nr:hypothetical protein AA0482_1197 [Acetobacter cibinongensis NRIC 0482]